MRLRGDSHPPAGRPRGSPLLWTGLESRSICAIVGAALLVARQDRSMLWSFCIPTVIRQQSPLWSPVLGQLSPRRATIKALPAPLIKFVVASVLHVVASNHT